jgi:hypothetical protein
MVFTTPVKSKGTEDMKRAFEEIFTQHMPMLPSRLFTDQGTEFEAKQMRKYFEDKMIDKQCSKDKSVKAGVAERMIRTIRHRMNRYFSDNNTTVWIDVLPKITDAINHSVCRMTSMRPIDVTPKNAQKLWKRLYAYDDDDDDDDKERRLKQKKTKFKPGDAVRLALEKPVFRKGTLPTFTDEIFRIDQAVEGKLSPTPHYYLRDHKGEKIKGRVYAPELGRTVENENTSYRIERVIRKRKEKNGTHSILVTFIGYPNEQYWIKQTDLVTT